MRAVLRNFSLILLAGALVVACETEEDDDDINMRDDYLGTWNVNETTGWNAPQFYTVQISEGNADNQVIIRGLYNISDTEVRAVIDGFQMSIPNQTSEGIQFTGSGQANADFDQINIDFLANDGSGQDEVEAVLTK